MDLILCSVTYSPCDLEQANRLPGSSILLPINGNNNRM